MNEVEKRRKIMGQKRKVENKGQRTTQQQHTGEQENKQTAAPSRQGGSNVESKIEELQSEWTLERIKEVAGAAVVLIGVFLTVKKRNKLEEAAKKVANVLGVESLQDWTPPEGLLSMLGIRKQEDVDAEVQKLQARLA
jgi:hypothetical protein